MWGKRGSGSQHRPLLKVDIEQAQKHTWSAYGAARYLGVAFRTYKKYAELYGLYDSHKWNREKGHVRLRGQIKGAYGLQRILNNEYPGYDKGKLKKRLIRAGLIEERCALCGFNIRRVLDNKCPLILCFMDGNPNNYNLPNLQLRCWNCVFLTTGRIQMIKHKDPKVSQHTDAHTYHQDFLDIHGMTPEEVMALHQKAKQELEADEESDQENLD